VYVASYGLQCRAFSRSNAECLKLTGTPLHWIICYIPGSCSENLAMPLFSVSLYAATTSQSYVADLLGAEVMIGQPSAYSSCGNT